MNKVWRFLPFAIVMGVVIIFATISLRDDPRLRDGPLLGQVMPTVVGLGPDDKQVNLQGGNGPYLLNVWASWCAPCQVEHPILLQMQADGVDIRGLIYKDSWADADIVLQRDGNPFSRMVLDVDGSLALGLGVSGAPETFVVDRDGIVQLHIVGIIDQQLYTRQIVPVLVGNPAKLTPS